MPRQGICACEPHAALARQCNYYVYMYLVTLAQVCIVKCVLHASFVRVAFLSFLLLT